MSLYPYTEDEAQIVRIQAAARGHITRKGVKAKAADPKFVSTADTVDPISGFSAEDEVQIVKIQSAARGHMARRGVKAKKAAASAPAAAPAAEEEFSAEDQAQIVKIQSAARGHIARKVRRCKLDPSI